MPCARSRQRVATLSVRCEAIVASVEPKWNENHSTIDMHFGLRAGAICSFTFGVGTDVGLVGGND